jgi:HPt (histidine-containing phosphotransfer) domain-containing protein
MIDAPTSQGEEVPELPALDPAALDRLKRFGGGKLLREMIALFLVAAPERLAAARAGVDAGDASEMEMALHSLKSSSAQLGAMRMQRLSEQGEQLARSGSAGLADAIELLVKDLEDEFVRVHAWLTKTSEESA